VISHDEELIGYPIGLETLSYEKKQTVALELALLPDKEIWGFPYIGDPQIGWFILEHPIKMDDLGVPILETSIKQTRVLIQDGLKSWLNWRTELLELWPIVDNYVYS
jgi:hypothetical protein